MRLQREFGTRHQNAPFTGVLQLTFPEIMAFAWNPPPSAPFHLPGAELAAYFLLSPFSSYLYFFDIMALDLQALQTDELKSRLGQLRRYL